MMGLGMKDWTGARSVKHMIKCCVYACVLQSIPCICPQSENDIQVSFIAAVAVLMLVHNDPKLLF